MKKFFTVPVVTVDDLKLGQSSQEPISIKVTSPSGREVEFNVCKTDSESIRKLQSSMGAIKPSSGYYNDKKGNRDSESLTDNFDYNNLFLNQLSDDKLEELFRIYAKAKDVVRNGYINEQKVAELSRLAKRLYNIVTYSAIEEFMSTQNVVIPTTVKETYEECGVHKRGRGNASYEKTTYLRSHYLDLVNLGVMLRFFMPIWSEYLTAANTNKSTSKDSNNEVKQALAKDVVIYEFYAWSMLSGTEIYNSPAVEKVRMLVELPTVTEVSDKNGKNVGSPMTDDSALAKAMMSASLYGMASLDIPEWCVARILVKRLVISKLSVSSNADSLIAKIHNEMTSSLGQLPRKTFGDLYFKDMTEEGASRDEDKSRVDKYKAREKFSVAEINRLNIFCESLEMIINWHTKRYQGTNVSYVDISQEVREIKEKLRENYQQVSDRERQTFGSYLNNSQQLIISYLVSQSGNKMISAEMFSYLTLESIMNLQAYIYCYCKHMLDSPMIAELIVSNECSESRRTNIDDEFLEPEVGKGHLMVGTRLDKATIERIKSQFRYFQRKGGKVKAEDYLVLTIIEKITTNVFSSKFTDINGKILDIPYNFSKELAELILKIS